MSENEKLRFIQYCLSDCNVGKRVVGSVLIERDYILSVPHLSRIFYWCRNMPSSIGGVYCAVSGSSLSDIIRSESSTHLDVSLRITVNYPKGEEVNGLSMGYEWIPLKHIKRINSLNDYLSLSDSYFIESGYELSKVIENNRHVRLTEENGLFLRGYILSKIKKVEVEDGKE